MFSKSIFHRKLADAMAEKEEISTNRNYDVDELKRHDSTLKIIDGHIKGLRGELETVNQDIRAISSSGGGRAARFGRQVPSVLSEIKKANFQGRVIGPIGMYIKIKEGLGNHAKALERILGGNSKSFIVTNSDDCNKLVHIMRRLNCESYHSVIVQKPHSRYNIMQVNAPTVADSITIEDDLVFNTVVDQCGIDRIAIIPDEHEGLNQIVCRGRNGFKSLIDSLASAVTLNGTTIKYVDGNQSSEIPKFSQVQKLFAEDMEEVVAELQQRVEKISEEISAKENSMQEGKQIRAELVGKLQAMDNSLLRLAASIKQISKEKQSADAMLVDVQEAGAIDTTVLESDQKQLIIDLEDFKAKLKNMEQRIESIRVEEKAKDSEKKELEERRNQLLSRIDEHGVELQKILDDRSNKTSSLHRLEKQIQRVDTEVANITKLIEKERKTFDKAVNDAEMETRTRIPNWDGEPLRLNKKDNRIKLEQEAKTLKIQYEKLKENAGLKGHTVAKLTSQVERASNDLNRMTSLYERLKKNLSDMDESYDSRKRRWTAMLKSNSKKVKEKFDEYLRKKNFGGTVVFDHKEQTLQLICQTDNTDDTTRNTNSSQLSGGERSYATFCLLLALGHVVSTHFIIYNMYIVFK